MLNLAQWQEIDSFYMAEGKVFQTLTRLAQSLDRAGISYAIVGGMAMAVQGFVRPTKDVNILLTPQGLAAFQQQLVGRGFVAAFSGATRKFKDAQTGVEIQIRKSGSFPGDGKPKPVVFPDPVAVAVDYNGIKVIDLTQLMELKLASGMTGRGRLRDLADVQDLIRTFSLPLELAESIDASVREKYLELWNDLNGG